MFRSQISNLKSRIWIFPGMVVAVTAMLGSVVRADTAPQDVLAMIPASAAAAVIIPNLKYCSDEITRFLEGMDRANLLLGTRPLDQLKSASGFNVGINDVGAAALIWFPAAGDSTRVNSGFLI